MFGRHILKISTNSPESCWMYLLYWLMEPTIYCTSVLFCSRIRVSKLRPLGQNCPTRDPPPHAHHPAPGRPNFCFTLVLELERATGPAVRAAGTSPAATWTSDQLCGLLGLAQQLLDPPHRPLGPVHQLHEPPGPASSHTSC